MRRFLHNLVDVVLAFGTRTHKRHVADKHIDELRCFVEAGLAEEFPESGDAGIGCTGQLRTTVLSILHHRTEFDDLEGFAFVPDTLLRVKDRPL